MMRRATRTFRRRLIVATAVLVGAVAPVSAAARPTSCPADPALRPVLTIGDRDSTGSDCVLRLERALDRWYPDAELKVDGRFARATRDAVRALQTHTTFEPYPKGVVDARTWQTVDRLVGATPRHPFSEAYPSVLILGASNTAHLRRIGLVEMLRLHGVTITRDDVDAVPGSATIAGPDPAIERLGERLDRGARPDLVMTFTGINDLGLAKWLEPAIMRIRDKELRRAAYVEVYAQMIQQFVDEVADRLGPVPIVWGNIAKRESKNLLARYFNEALVRVQSELAAAGDPTQPALTIVDFATRMAVHQDEFRPDGIHLTHRGLVARLECMLHVVDAVDTYANTTTITCPDDPVA